MKQKITSTQPEPVKGQRIYGSQPVEPMHEASNQPEPLPHTRVRGQRTMATVRVKMKDGEGREMIIAASDFDAAIHERLA